MIMPRLVTALQRRHDEANHDENLKEPKQPVV